MATSKRSPQYPFIPLERAIKRVQEFYDQEGRHAAPLSVALSSWKYNAKSSGGMQTAAALKGYGLIEYGGKGEKRTLKLSDAALRIILDKRPNSSERHLFIQQAALKPKIFSSLWTQWKEDGIPSEANMRHTLIFEYDFIEKTVEDFIKVFKKTFQYAGLSSSEDLEEQEEDSYNEEEEINPPLKQKRPPMKPGMQQATYPLDEGDVFFQWPKLLSEASKEELDTWIDLLKRKIKRSASESPEQEED